jgi:hypothetical protein
VLELFWTLARGFKVVLMGMKTARWCRRAAGSDRGPMEFSPVLLGQ